MSTPLSNPPPSVERWAHQLITTRDLSAKLSPPGVPDRWQPNEAPAAPAAPGRPPQLRPATNSFKTPSAEQLRAPRARAHLLHTFLHHELQAAELMAWALLRFPLAEPSFRRGLLGILQEELEHANRYAFHLRNLGFAVGDFPVRDWFWRRVPSCQTPVQFVALMGLGLESANLEHCVRFERDLRLAGDTVAADLQADIERDETRHVAFARHWYERWQGKLSFEGWCAQLPKPLSPLLLRGRPLNQRARRAAGIPPAFLEQLEAWNPSPGS